MLVALRLTVKVMFVEPLSPSFTLGESMETESASSFLIVPIPVPVPMSTPAPKESPLNRTTTVSSGSGVLSPCTATVTVLLV